MAQALSREEQLAEAHREGLRHASEVYASAYLATMAAYPGDPAMQEMYLAGLLAELRRLTKGRGR